MAPTRRRRRCGPPVGRPRGTSPWCPPALHGLESDREGGFTPTRPAKHHGGGSPIRLLPLSPGPRYVHAPALHVAGSPHRGTEWGARRSAGSTSGTVHHPPKGRGTQSHGCGPLAHQALPTGRRLAGGSRGLGPWPGPPPSPNARHFCRRCPCAGPSSNPPVVSPKSAVPHVCGGDTQTPASVYPKRRRPPRLSGGGLGGPKAKEAPSPQRRGPW